MSILIGIGLICSGIFIVVLQIKKLRAGMKDEWGYGRSLLIAGIGFIMGGVIMLLQNL